MKGDAYKPDQSSAFKLFHTIFKLLEFATSGVDEVRTDRLGSKLFDFSFKALDAACELSQVLPEEFKGGIVRHGSKRISDLRTSVTPHRGDEGFRV